MRHLNRAASLLLLVSGLVYLASAGWFMSSLLSGAAERGLGGFEAVVGLLFSVAPAMLILAALSLLASYRLWAIRNDGTLLGAIASILGVLGALHFAPLEPLLPLIFAINSAALGLLLYIRGRPTLNSK